MPAVYVSSAKLFQALGRTYTVEEFRKLCFAFGVELDDVTSEKAIAENELANKRAQGIEVSAEISKLSEEELYKIDVPANRYDLLCLEGLARALRIYNLDEKCPEYKVVTPPKEKTHKMYVKAPTKQIRPFVVAAVLRDLKFDETSYKSFIELQDKLHQNICRKRTLVAIGTHDLDTIHGPFTYEALPPKDIKFKPLNENREFNAEELFRYYKEEKKQNTLKNYLHIIENSPVYPVIYDSKRVVLSLPPIINGEHSKITLNTKNVFIECTGTDYTKANIVLNTVIAMFSQYCKTPFTAESVEIVYEETGKVDVLPNMKDNIFLADPKYINTGIGISIPAEEMATLLNRMQLPAEYDAKQKVLKVRAPPTRSDILHACDVMEDVAIAYGYNNVKRTIPATSTVGRQLPINKISDLIRENVAQAGVLEVLTWALVSHKENFAYLQKPDDGKTAVVLSNPVSTEFDIVRTSLLPGLLKTVSNSKSKQLPMKLFEVGDVCLLDPTKDVGARNNRRIAVIYGGTTSGFEFIHSVLDRIMLLNEMGFEGDVEAEKKAIEEWKKKAAEKKSAEKEKEPKQKKYRGSYALGKSEDASFFPGRRADIIVNGKQKIGVMGIIHPEVLKAFEITYPVSALELDLEVFL